MNAIASVWLQFAVCVLLIGIAGVKLSRYGDIIADKTGLGGTWIGVILLATVTSLPELATGVSAVTAAQVPDIAIGDLLGACIFNLTILVVLDFLYREESVYRRASQGHILSAGFGVILIAFVGFNLLLGARGAMWAIGHVGVYTPVIIAMYMLAMRSVFVYERERRKEFVEEVAERYPDITLREASIRYVLAALVVVGAGTWLPFIGDQMGTLMGWHRTFVGTLFIAFATTVPELVITVSALRLGALDMAIGNLLGSNLFDVAIIAVDDLLYLKGPILSDVSIGHATSAMSATVMSGIVIVGLLYRPRTRLFKTVGWASVFLFSVYLINFYVLFLHGN